MRSKHFKAAFDRTMKTEGGYSDDPQDSGGETFRGISRLYWPEWSGWHLVDGYRKEGFTSFEKSGMNKLVESFYWINFWQRIQGGKLAAVSQEVAYEVFDTAVNMDVPDAVRFLQTALNMQRMSTRAFSELMVDGRLGKKTLSALSLYLATQPGDPESNEKILLACMNGEQYLAYKSNPQHVYFRGWFLRV